MTELVCLISEKSGRMIRARRNGLELDRGDLCLVESEFGGELARVADLSSELCCHAKKIEAAPAVLRKATEDDADKMVEGVARFPRNTLLAYRSALVCAQSGYAAKAAELIDRGLLFATDESKKDFVGRLRAALAAPVIPDTKQPNAVK